MKIAIVSDTHDNWANFKKALDWIKKENIQLVLHCGDANSQDTIDNAKRIFNDIRFVKGNADFGLDLPDNLEVEIDPSAGSGQAQKIFFVHFPNEAKKAAQSGNFDMVFYGHTHRPWEEKVGNCHLINPGELAGQFYKPTFAVYDTSTKSLELKILEKI
jgi:hypothetical protein